LRAKQPSNGNCHRLKLGGKLPLNTAELALPPIWQPALTLTAQGTIPCPAIVFEEKDRQEAGGERKINYYQSIQNGNAPVRKLQTQNMLNRSGT
jgi:hypothetical protein